MSVLVSVSVLEAVELIGGNEAWSDDTKYIHKNQTLMKSVLEPDNIPLKTKRALRLRNPKNSNFFREKRRKMSENEMGMEMGL